MKPLGLGEIARLCGGRLIAGDPDVRVTEVGIDSRALAHGALFVALVGGRCDAHDFLEQAAGNAAACVVSRLPQDVDSFPAALIQVEDTLAALQALAGGYRATLDITVVCVTGSNGKTSTKDFLNAVLSGKFEVNATAGNFNNHIGLPLTILRTGARHTCGVWEIGMSNPGEIEPLAALARPDVAVITNIGTAHIEFMKSREAIAREKGMLVEAVAADGCVVLNANDEYTPALAGRTRAQVVTAGVGAGSVRAENLDLRGDRSEFDIVHDAGAFHVKLPVAGEHMIANATLAAAAALHLGVAAEAIAEGLAAVSITRGRLQFRQVNGRSFIDDSYNANPDSMRAALAALRQAKCAGRRVAALGAMAELGDGSIAAHRDIGRKAFADFGVDVLYTVGSAAAEIAHGFREAGGTAAYCCDSHADCRKRLEAHAADDLILVKGSRSSAMENVIPEPDDS